VWGLSVATSLRGTFFITATAWTTSPRTAMPARRGHGRPRARRIFIARPLHDARSWECNRGADKPLGFALSKCRLFAALPATGSRVIVKVTRLGALRSAPGGP